MYTPLPVEIESVMNKQYFVTPYVARKWILDWSELNIDVLNPPLQPVPSGQAISFFHSYLAFSKSILISSKFPSGLFFGPQKKMLLLGKRVNRIGIL